MADWYRVMGVSRQASEKEIKSAYRRLAKKYHPDAHPGDRECEMRFREITEAYATLSDPQKRRRHDEELDIQPQKETKDKKHADAASDYAHGGKVNFQDVSESFERFFGFNPKTKKAVNGGKLDSNEKQGNPLDATDIFEAFMGNMKR